MTADLERVLIDLARDPGEAVWRPGWEQSPPVKAVLAALVAQLADLAAARGLTGDAIRTGQTAADELARLFARMALERAAGVLAVFAAAGLRIGVRDGRLMLGPRDRVTDEHKRMVREWREELIRVLERTESPAPRLATVG